MLLSIKFHRILNMEQGKERIIFGHSFIKSFIALLYNYKDIFTFKIICKQIFLILYRLCASKFYRSEL